MKFDLFQLEDLYRAWEHPCAMHEIGTPRGVCSCPSERPHEVIRLAINHIYDLEDGAESDAQVIEDLGMENRSLRERIQNLEKRSA